MDDEVKPTPMDQVIEAAGGTALLAQHLGIQAPSIYSWRRVPVARVKAVAALTKIPPHELRPDVWDAPEGTKRRKAAPESAPSPPTDVAA
jgi:DNA-binding transcriptional regulator YdaS (Cro superfamily)